MGKALLESKTNRLAILRRWAGVIRIRLYIIPYVSKSYDDVESFYAQYQTATNPSDIRYFKEQSIEAEDEMNTSNDQLTMMFQAAAAVHLANMVHALLLGPKETTASQRSQFQLGYDPIINQPQLRFTIALD